MPIAFAINGLGRVGRALLRIALDRPGLLPVAVNDLAGPERLARLLARDSLRGPLGRPVAAEPGVLVAGHHRLAAFREPDPGRVPWEATGARVVVEATGAFTCRAEAAAHLRGPVAKVVVSANGPDLDLTVCLGVNDGAYDPDRHHVISNASCTTNCLAPLARVLHEAFGLERALLSTVHCYTATQPLLDAPHADPRRARAAPLNMIPTTTGAVAAIGEVLPALAGRIAGFAVRVPVPDVSLIDLVAELAARPEVERVREAFRAAAAGELAGLLAVTEEEPVSCDLRGDPHSAVVDLPLVQEVGRRLYRVVAWYDNEWGYASRLADLVERVGGAR